MITPKLVTREQYLTAIEQGKANSAQLTDYNMRQNLMGRDDKNQIYNALKTLAELSKKKE